MFWSQLSIKLKFLVIVIVAVFAIIATALYSSLQLRSSIYSLENILARESKNEMLAAQANIEFKRQVQEWKNVLLRGHDSARNQKYWRQFKQQEEKVRSIVTELIAGLEEQPELRQTAEDFLRDHQKMGTAYAAGKSAFEQDGFNHKTGDKAVSGIDRAPSAAMQELGEKLAELSLQAQAAAIATADSAITTTYVLLLIITLVVVLITYYSVNRLIVNPMSTQISAIRELSEGNLSIEFEVKRQDELGRLGLATQDLKDFLSASLNEMKETSLSLHGRAKELDNVASEISHASEQQHKSTDQIATAIEEMANSAHTVADYAAATAESTEATDEKVNASSKAMSLANNTIDHLVKEIADASEVIKQLATDSANVGSVLNVIRGIAEQTNLLALNAAIEAARAGEQGRGFAVVADEVRSLAQRTQDSTIEIESILEKVQSGAEAAVKAMETGKTRTDDVVEKVSQANENLAAIVTAIGDITQKSTEISTSSSEQSQVAEELSGLVAQLTELSENTRNQVDQANTISKGLLSLSKGFDQHLSRFDLSS